MVGLHRTGHLSAGHDDEVGAEQVDERLVMLGQDPAGLRELVRIAEDHLGVAQRLLSRHSQHRVTLRRRVCGQMARDHPVVAGPHEAADEDHALLQRFERCAAHVGSGPVGELVQDVDQHQDVTVLAGDVEDALDDVLPPQQHVPFGVGQLGTGRDERLDDGASRPEPVLQGEVVQDHGEHRLIGHQPAGKLLGDHRRQFPVETGRQGEVDQLCLEVPGPLHQIHPIPPSAVAATFLREHIRARPGNPGESGWSRRAGWYLRPPVGADLIAPVARGFYRP